MNPSKKNFIPAVIALCVLSEIAAIAKLIIAMNNQYGTASIVILASYILAPLLFLLGAMFFHQSKCAGIIISFSFLMPLINCVVSMIANMVYAFNHPFPQMSGWEYYVNSYLDADVGNIILFLPLVFSAIGAWKGFWKKRFIIAPMIWICILCIISLLSRLFFTKNLRFDQILFTALNFAFFMCFAIAAMLFAGKNTIYPLIKPSQKAVAKRLAKHKTAEQKLNELQQWLDIGFIGTETYEAQRAQVLYSLSAPVAAAPVSVAVPAPTPAPTPAPAAIPVSAHIYCGKCGAQNAAGACFCGKCGAGLPH